MSPQLRVAGWLTIAAVFSTLAFLAVVHSMDWAAWLAAAGAVCCYRECLIVALWDHKGDH